MSDESKALAIAPRTGIVLPAVDTAGAVQAWNEYVKLCEAIIKPEDVQKTWDGDFRKKSAFRKLARFYDLTDRIVEREVVRDERGRPTFAAFTVRATAPNGREAEGYHECHLSERCCDAAFEEDCLKEGRGKHKCCPSNCSGWSHWSHPGDIPATAHTRAKNRAISDLIGAGEVSAEEVGDLPDESTQASQAPVRHDVDRSLGWCSLHLCGKVEGNYGPYCPNKLPGGHWCKGDPDTKAAPKPAPAPAVKPEAPAGVVVGEARLFQPSAEDAPSEAAPTSVPELMKRANEKGVGYAQVCLVANVKGPGEILAKDIPGVWAGVLAAAAKKEGAKP